MLRKEAPNAFYGDGHDADGSPTLAQAMDTAESTMAGVEKRQGVIAGLKEETDRFLSGSYVRRPFPGMREQHPGPH